MPQFDILSRSRHSFLFTVFFYYCYTDFFRFFHHARKKLTIFLQNPTNFILIWNEM